MNFIYFTCCIFVEASINGGPSLLFLVDTGANVSAIDARAAEKSGLVVEPGGHVETTTGVIETKKAQVRDLAVGTAHAKLAVTVQDLSGGLAPKGRQLAGILGSDFLRLYQTKIDFKARTIAFMKKGTGQRALPGWPVVRVPFILDNGIPRVTAILHRKVETELRLDTGASLFDTPDIYINITEGTWKRLTGLDHGLVVKRFFKGQSGGREVRLPVASVNDCGLASLHVSKVHVIVQPALGYFARSDAVGFISNNFLEKFSPVSIDYTEKELLLSEQHDSKSVPMKHDPEI